MVTEEQQGRALETAQSLLSHCRERNWSGYDPYDALNSRLLSTWPVLDSRIPRIVLTQLLKRSPVNLRPVLQIPAMQNPKGLALFLGALVDAPEIAGADADELIGELTQRLIDLRAADHKYWCWGYSFPWQTRTILAPRWAPNLVCSCFVSEALLNLFDKTGDGQYLDMAHSAANYIARELYFEDGDSAGFAYPIPTLQAHVYNANLLGAALLCRVAKKSGDDKLVAPALKVARFSAAQQREDGSWLYGAKPTQDWVDNFHTGYNLTALRQIGECLDTKEFAPRLARGVKYYFAHFYREDGAPRYFHNNTYPIDVHCVAQGILTGLEFRDVHPEGEQRALATFAWARRHMWSRKGHFHYRVLRAATIRTSYMRWGQAWMLRALAAILRASREDAARRQELSCQDVHA